MSKKILISILIALLIAASVGVTAFAQTNTTAAGKIGRRAIGQLTAINGSELSLKALKGDTVTFQVDGSTLYRDQTGSLIQASALEVGQEVAVAAVSNGQGGLVARLVMVLPDGFVKGEANLFRRARGQVIAVEANSFTLHTLNNEDLTFQVDSGTAFVGEAKSLSEVKVGMQGGVLAVNRPDKTLLALAVRLGSPVSRFIGSVTAVDPTAMTLSLHTRSGEDLTFEVTADTTFAGMNGSIKSLADIKTGMIAAVVAIKQADGSYMARKIGAVNKADLPKVEFRNLGKVTSVSDDGFIIKVRFGKEIQYTVSTDTKFPGPVKSLSDLKPGMTVLVGADQVGDELVAMVVWGR